MQRCLIAICGTLAAVCIAQASSSRASEREEPASPTHDLSVVSLQATARDDLNVFFDVVVRNNTQQPIPSKLITIECIFTKHPRYDPAEKTNQYGGKSAFGGVKPVPPSGELPTAKHARLVDVAGRQRLDAGYRYLQVRVLHQPPAKGTSEVLADVAAIDLTALPPDLPRRPPSKTNPDSKRNASGPPSDWVGTPFAAILLAPLSWLSKGIGRAFRTRPTQRSRVVAAAVSGALLGAILGFGFIWMSPFRKLRMFRVIVPLFFALISAVLAGNAASESGNALSIGIRDID